MRVLFEIARPDCKVTAMSWNEKYLVKIEQGACEQIFKIPHLDIDSADSLKSLIDEEFISHALKRFVEMHADVQKLVD